ncbi:hypothetical protein [Micromonospora craterilacus]|uniref:hypothetical protein n=1 Tax=Micromonospora craterilacus TaxID=1655439 RepID=UPI0011B58167|nr:hypothetical protein [Micromonospora craterilacus]
MLPVPTPASATLFTPLPPRLAARPVDIRRRLAVPYASENAPVFLFRPLRLIAAIRFEYLSGIRVEIGPERLSAPWTEAMA